METPAADVGPEPTATGEMTTLFYKSISSSAAKINEKTIDFLSRHGQNNSIPYIAEGNDFVCKYYLSAERKAAYDNGGK